MRAAYGRCASGMRREIVRSEVGENTRLLVMDR